MKFQIFLVLCIFGATIASPVLGPETAIVNGINVQPGTNARFHVHVHLSMSNVHLNIFLRSNFQKKKCVS